MKVELAALDPDALPRHKGSYLVVDTKWGPRLVTWPKPRGKAKTPYDWFRQQEFAIAGWMAANPSPLDYLTAVEMTKGTHQVPRDFLTMCAFGRAYTLVGPSGIEWRNFRDVTNNPQYVLDQVTDEPGSMLYRSDIGWIGIPGGLNGQVLTFGASQPGWATPSGGGGALPPSTLVRMSTPETSANVNPHVAVFDTTPIRDDLGIFDPATPDRLFPPTAYSHWRITWQISTKSFNSNALNAMRVADQANVQLSPIPVAVTFSGIGSNVKRGNATSPWLEIDPAIDYIRLLWSLDTSLTTGLDVGTALQIEAANL